MHPPRERIGETKCGAVGCESATVEQEKVRIEPKNRSLYGDLQNVCKVL